MKPRHPTTLWVFMACYRDNSLRSPYLGQILIIILRKLIITLDFLKEILYAFFISFIVLHYRLSNLICFNCFNDFSWRVQITKLPTATPFSTLFLNTHNTIMLYALFFSINDHVSHEYKTTDKTVVAYILIFRLLSTRRGDLGFWSEWRQMMYYSNLISSQFHYVHSFNLLPRT
jgi:hypothetical protein